MLVQEIDDSVRAIGSAGRERVVCTPYAAWLIQRSFKALRLHIDGPKPQPIMTVFPIIESNRGVRVLQSTTLHA